MKLLFLLLFSNHYSARDHKVNEKKKEKLDLAYKEDANFLLG
jgi:hypothetical protein